MVVNGLKLFVKNFEYLYGEKLYHKVIIEYIHQTVVVFYDRRGLVRSYVREYIKNRGRYQLDSVVARVRGISAIVVSEK